MFFVMRWCATEAAGFYGVFGKSKCRLLNLGRINSFGIFPENDPNMHYL
jgi:hypothetical protein